MNESIRRDIPQVSNEDNDILTACFTEENVKKATFQMEHNKASGPDGFPTEFYQTFWEVIKRTYSLFLKIFKLPLFSLNFCSITLLPKQKESKQIQQFRTICLLNVSFKVFTKVLTERSRVQLRRL